MHAFAWGVMRYDAWGRCIDSRAAEPVHAIQHKRLPEHMHLRRQACTVALHAICVPQHTSFHSCLHEQLVELHTTGPGNITPQMLQPYCCCKHTHHCHRPTVVLSFLICLPDASPELLNRHIEHRAPQLSLNIIGCCKCCIQEQQ